MKYVFYFEAKIRHIAHVRSLCDGFILSDVSDIISLFLFSLPLFYLPVL